MKDREASAKMVPFLGTKVFGPTKEGVFRIQKIGPLALEFARRVATTTDSKAKIDKALTECRKLWAEGWID